MENKIKDSENLKEIQDDTIEYFRCEGINFIPIKKGDKVPAISSWKEFQSRKITQEEEGEYFSNAQYNLAAVTGSISGLAIIDIDSEEVFNKFFPVIPEGMTYVKTAQGYHVYMKMKEPLQTFNCYDSAGRAVITVKGEGGYCVAPGSLHSTGVIYKFEKRAHLKVVESGVRGAIIDKAKKIGLDVTAAEKSEIYDIEKLLLGTGMGNRDNNAVRIASHLSRQGASCEDAKAIMVAWNARNLPPLEDYILDEKITSNYPPNTPYSFYFLKDPGRFAITKELSIIDKTQYEMAANIEKVLSTDAIVIDDKGCETVDMDIVCDYIESNFIFKSVRSLRSLLMYKNGIYVEGETRLSEILEKEFGGLFSIRKKDEIIRRIRDRNMIEQDMLNTDKTHLVVKNGALNLETFKLEAFDPALLATKALPVTFDPDVDAVRFIEVISQILPQGDATTLQEMFGYSLWPVLNVHKSFWFIGGGGNGKGTIVRVLENLLGVINVAHIPLSQMDGQHRFAAYNLHDKMANISAEPSTLRAMETSFFKQAVGGDAIPGEIKGVQGEKQFLSAAKLIILANNLPTIADQSEGFWRRVIAIPFKENFTNGPEEIFGLGELLSTSEGLTGVLNWALAGLKRLKSNNWKFTITSGEIAQKTEMQIQSNPLKAFIDNWLKMDRTAEIPKRSLYDAYNLFSLVNEISSLYGGVISKTLFKDKRITSRQIRIDGHRSDIFQGCALSDGVVAAYGWYRSRPLRQGEITGIENSEETVEIRTCCLEDYFMQYPEPIEEVQGVFDDKRIIFNNADLVELFKQQKTKGAIKHQGPQTRDPDQFSDPREEEKHKSKADTLTIKTESPAVKGVCERCGGQAHLTHKVIDDNSEYFVCYACARELKDESGKDQPPMFNTTLEERREKLSKKEETE